MTAGHPTAAAAIRAARARIATRALEIAIDGDPTLRDRYAELALRELLADTEALADRLAASVASADPTTLGRLAEQLAPRYRKRRVPMDDVIEIAEGLRAATSTVVMPDAMPAVNAALDSAIAALRWHRRIGGDARRRNPVIAFIYKGA